MRQTACNHHHLEDFLTLELSLQPFWSLWNSQWDSMGFTGEGDVPDSRLVLRCEHMVSQLHLTLRAAQTREERLWSSTQPIQLHTLY